MTDSNDTITPLIDAKLQRQVDLHPFPLMFCTISGAHLYGFPSTDSDFDMRGVHLLPLESVVGLNPGEETVEKSGIHDGLEIDLVTHDVRKFIGLMLRKNGYVLEQLLSPLVVRTSDEHEELKSLAPKCITRHHAHHYRGFAETQWKLFGKENPPRVKPLLYVFRVLLTGIHLMRTGEIEANLIRLNEEFPLPFIPELVRRKIEGAENEILKEADVKFYCKVYERLLATLAETHRVSQLPDGSNATDDLNRLLIKIRVEST